MGDSFYRLDLCAYSKQLYDRCGIHTMLPLCRVGSEWKYGVPKMDFLKGGPDIAMTVIGQNPNDSDRQAIQSIEDRMPILNPIDFTATNFKDSIDYHHHASQPSFATDPARVYARVIDWTDDDHRRFTQSIEREGTFEILSYQKTIPLMNHVFIVMYELVAKK